MAHRTLKVMSASNKKQRNTHVEKLFTGLSKMILMNLTLRLLFLLSPLICLAISIHSYHLENTNEALTS